MDKDRFLVAYATRSESLFEVVERGQSIKTRSAVQWLKGHTVKGQGEHAYWMDRATWERAKPLLTHLVHRLANHELLAVKVKRNDGGVRCLVRIIGEREELSGKFVSVKIPCPGKVVSEELKTFSSDDKKALCRAIREAAGNE